VFSQQGIEDRKLFFFLDMSEGEEGMGEELKDAVQPAQLAIENHEDPLDRAFLLIFFLDILSEEEIDQNSTRHHNGQIFPRHDDHRDLSPNHEGSTFDGQNVSGDICVSWGTISRRRL
jgi:hypothetical protein